MNHAPRNGEISNNVTWNGREWVELKPGTLIPGYVWDGAGWIPTTQEMPDVKRRNGLVKVVAIIVLGFVGVLIAASIYSEDQRTESNLDGWKCVYDRSSGTNTYETGCNQ